MKRQMKTILVVAMFLLLSVPSAMSVTSAKPISDLADEFTGKREVYSGTDVVVGINGTLEDPEDYNLKLGTNITFKNLGILEPDVNETTNDTVLVEITRYGKDSLVDDETLDYGNETWVHQFDKVGLFNYTVTFGETNISAGVNYTVGRVNISAYNLVIDDLMEVEGIKVAMRVVGDFNPNALKLSDDTKSSWFGFAEPELHFYMNLGEHNDSIDIELTFEGLEEDIDVEGTYGFGRNTAVIVSEDDEELFLMTEEGEFEEGTLEITGDEDMTITLPKGVESVTVKNNLAWSTRSSLILGWGVDGATLIEEED